MRDIPVAKFAYVGPTITGVAIRNTIYSKTPEGLRQATEVAPYLAALCIPVRRLSEATAQIQAERGAFWRLYSTALQEAPKLIEYIQKGVV